MKRTRAVPVFLAAALLAPVGAALEPAAADETCTGELTLPERLAVTPASAHGYYTPGFAQVELTGTCSPDQTRHWFYWYTRDADGRVRADITVDMEPCEPPTVDVGPLKLRQPPPLGPVTFIGKGRRTCVDGVMPLRAADATTDIRTKSWGYISASRSGSKVHLAARGMRYWTSTQSNGSWADAKGVIQYRDAEGSEWKSLKNVTTDSAGHDSYVYTTSARRSYRVLFPNQPFIWGSVSEATPTT